MLSGLGRREGNTKRLLSTARCALLAQRISFSLKCETVAFLSQPFVRAGFLTLLERPTMSSRTSAKCHPRSVIPLRYLGHRSQTVDLLPQIGMVTINTPSLPFPHRCQGHSTEIHNTTPASLPPSHPSCPSTLPPICPLIPQD